MNRAAQRYLCRRSNSLPVVAVPGSDVGRETEWDLAAVARDTVDIVSGSHRLAVVDGALTLENSVEPIGRWVAEPAGDGWVHLVSAEPPSRLLAVRPSGGRELELVLETERDRAAMWQVHEECVRDARSVHLRYGVDREMSVFYNEVFVDEAPPGTFFCTSGFGANARDIAPSGYAGIQHRGDGTRRAIFSVWHRMADEVNPVLGSSAMAVGAHPDAHTTLFSGEGSGASIRMPLAWSEGRSEPIRFVLTAERLGPDTAIAAYVSHDGRPWTHLGVIVREQTSGRLMGRPYAFIEDFLRNGNAPGVPPRDRSPYRARSAQFTNPWFGKPAASLSPVPEVTVTVYSPHPLENLTARLAAGDRFGIDLATGTDSAFEPPPIGARFQDRVPVQRPLPSLDGVPAV